MDALEKTEKTTGERPRPSVLSSLNRKNPIVIKKLSVVKIVFWNVQGLNNLAVHEVK